MSNSAGVSRKAEDAYHTVAPGQHSQFLVESELLIYYCYFVCIVLVISHSLLCMSVFHVGSMSFDYFLLISARILIPLITLRRLSEFTFDC